MPARFAFRSTLAAMIAALCLAGPAQSQTTSTWDSGIGNWTAVAHWNTPFFPNNGNGGVNWDAIVNGGTVTLDQNITVNGYTMGGGSLVAPGSGGPFTLNVNNTLNLSAGTLGSGVILQNNGVADIGGNFVMSGQFINAGTVNNGGNSGSSTNGLITNLAGANYILRSLQNLQGTGTFENYGTFTSQQVGGTGNVSYIYWDFNDHPGSVINANSMTMYMWASGVHDGTWNLNNSAFQAAGNGTHTFNSDSVITGVGGNFYCWGPSIAVNGTYTIGGLTWVTSTLTFNSSFGGTGGLRIDSTGTVNFNLPTTLTSIALNGGAWAA